MEFKGTKGKWEVKHSESKDAFNIIGTALGSKYKIARCPYILVEDNGVLSRGYNQKETAEVEANANLIAMAPELLEAMIEFVERVDKGEVRSTKTYNKFKELIAKATT
jgi:hypothetical protein